jgi:hypothetical protein
MNIPKLPWKGQAHEGPARWAISEGSKKGTLSPSGLNDIIDNSHGKVKTSTGRVMYQILCQRRRRGYHLEWVKVKKKEVPRDTTFGNTEFATSI